MPFKSQAQRRKFAELLVKGKISAETFEEWVTYLLGGREYDLTEATAQRLGFRSVWIDRRHDRPGGGATPPADARPDATYPSMESFAAAAVPDVG